MGVLAFGFMISASRARNITNALLSSDPKDDGLHNIFTDEEVNKCSGLISKNPQLVKTDKKIFLITACGMGGREQAKGKVLSSSGRRLDPISNNKCIMKSSDDGGYNWKDFKVFSPGGFDGHNYVDCKGIYDHLRKRLIIQFDHVRDNKHTLYQIISEDDGRSFSKPRDLSKYLKGCGAGKVTFGGNNAGDRIQLPLSMSPQGRILFGGHATHEICLWYSDDGGHSYNTTRPSHPHTNEWSMAVADAKSGKLLINSRAGDQKTRKNFWSHDGGLTWDGPHESGLKDPENQHDHGCEASLINFAGILYFFNPTGSGDDSRVDMEVRCSKDHGKTWPHSYKITSTTDGGYSDMVHHDGKLLLVWGAGYGGSHIANPHRNMYVQHIGTQWC
jgi:hypothetical protein